MNAKPMLFQSEMIRAIQREIEQPGTGKTQTRRTNGLDDVNGESHPAGEWALSRWVDASTPLFVHTAGCRIAHPRCPYGQPGDLLWVRETIWQEQSIGNAANPESGCNDPVNVWGQKVAYRAETPEPPSGMANRPSIHMPRWASRYTLLLTDVRVERGQEISEDDARAEGAEQCDVSALSPDEIDLLDAPLAEPTAPFRNGFALLWESIQGPGAWDRNEWVWALTFRPIPANVDDVLADPAAYGIREAA